MSAIFKNDYKLCALGVNNNTRVVFDLMRHRMDECNIVHLSVDLKLKFMAKTTSRAQEPLDAFKTILLTLKRADVVRFKSDGAYMLNPDFGVKYENSLKRIRQEWQGLVFKKRNHRKAVGEPHSPMEGVGLPREGEPHSLPEGTPFPPLRMVK